MTQRHTTDHLPTAGTPTTDGIDHAAGAPHTDPVRRRTALRAGAAGVAAAAASVVAISSGAQAAAGQPVVQGGSNVVGTPTTYLFSSGATPTLQVRNTGSGAAAFFFGQNQNGFAGGTGGANRYGLSAANTGAAGTGAGMAASGGNNTGILANTANADRYAMEAVNLATAEGMSGGVLADGGQGVGLVAVTDNPQVPALVVGGATVSFGDTILSTGALALTYTDTAELFGVVSAGRPALTLAGTTTLSADGSATITLPPEVVNGADTADASVVATPRSGSMPNLFASVSGTGVVTISGGTASGTVNYQVTLHQPLLQRQLGQRTSADPSSTPLERARAIAASAARD